jgi:hypothetical protein
MARRRPRRGGAGRWRSSRPLKGPAKDADLPDPSSPEFAYLVAVHAWIDGLTAGSIVKKLDLPSHPRYLMQVKRALKRAHGRFFRLIPPANVTLPNELAKRFRQSRRPQIRFHVVDDTRGSVAAPVYAKAAELVVELVFDSLQRRWEPDGRHIVICNAGGKAVSETVKALVRNPPVLDESDERTMQLGRRLQFVAANGAYHARQFHRSANFLSVTMAEMFGSQHVAVPVVGYEEFRAEHRKLVDDAAVFVCGAGSRDSGLVAKYLREHGIEIPSDVVGDLAFNLLDKDGRGVKLPTPEGQRFLELLNPILDLSTVQHIATGNRVLLILASDDPREKRQIGAAALKRGYATDVLLGTRLAEALLSE